LPSTSPAVQYNPPHYNGHGMQNEHLPLIN
jgi:hypothetical protein